MPGSSERDSEVCASILRNLATAALDCEQLAAGYAADDLTDNATDLHMAALRYRQLAARAIGIWAEADALTALCANAATDPETASCDAPTIVLEV